ncbi:hypothetical protein EVAR_10802_1 [Eumeta japonica]|uniref:Uncharacterized protein n=1 Tax=Eumeta variegata TaxID=151549 RepID=A0A4C1YAD9_EUMVA|nr:hypothetical protein EVAR_10802_1 [Eumeta japonica]
MPTFRVVLTLQIRRRFKTLDAGCDLEARVDVEVPQPRDDNKDAVFHCHDLLLFEDNLRTLKIFFSERRWLVVKCAAIGPRGPPPILTTDESTDDSFDLSQTTPYSSCFGEHVVFGRRHRVDSYSEGIVLMKSSVITQASGHIDRVVNDRGVILSVVERLPTLSNDCSLKGRFLIKIIKYPKRSYRPFKQTVVGSRLGVNQSMRFDTKTCPVARRTR